MRYDDSNITNDLASFGSIKDAELLVGGLSKPGKMPWFGWSVSAKRCKVGGKLAKQVGSVCHGCYALKGRYVFPGVQSALDRRLDCSNGPLFVPAFVFLLNTKAAKIPAQQRYFRWFDSGDIQSIDMLWNINTIAKHTPTVKHWLPTKEVNTVREFYKYPGIQAPNLTIRVSAPMMDQSPIWPIGSSVFTDKVPDGAKRCPAPSQGNQCRDCRTCWNPSVPHVSYHSH